MRKPSVLLMVSFAVLLTSCVTISLFGVKRNIKRVIQKYPFITSITEIWGFDGSGGDFNDPVALDIKMDNGKRLFLSYISSSDLKSPFQLHLIEKSTFIIYTGHDKFGYYTSFSNSIPIDFISRNIQIELNSVEDVIDNYDLILNFTNSLTKLADINELLDIDDRYRIVDLGFGSEGRVGLSWRKHIKPIKNEYLYKNEIYEQKFYILNITQDEFPDAYTFYQIENKTEGGERYIHYRN